MTTRRDFVKTTGAALGSAALIGTLGPGLTGCTNDSLSFGFQSWTLRDQLAEDMPGTLRMMAEQGYSEVEFCSPIGYTGTPFEQFRKLTGTELKSIIESSGLKCESSHYSFGEMKNELQAGIDWSHEMGIKHVICSSFWLGEDATIDGYRQSCEELNEIALKLDEAGFQTGFHNHHMEFDVLEGQLVYDVLLEELDPKLVKMQFQVAVVNIGYHAADQFRAHPGRFISAHLADWSNEKEAQVPIGQGIVDWPDFFEAAETGGLSKYFVEMAPETFTPSAGYLKSM